MTLYRSKPEKVLPLPPYPFKLEKDLQSWFEQNLTTLTDLEFVSSEFRVYNRRLDTLAYDSKRKSFVIIEYKRGKNYSVVDQGMAYLNLMLSNKADFVLEYNEQKNASLKRADVNWPKCRLFFVSPEFTRDQIEASNYREFNIELWEVKRYEENLFDVQHYEGRHVDSPSPNTTLKTEQNDQESNTQNEAKDYTEADVLKMASPKTNELYKELKNKILDIGADIVVQPKKYVIGFKGQRIFADITIQREGIKLWLNKKWGEIKDPEQLARNVANVGHWGNGDYEIKIEDNSRFSTVMKMIRQSYGAKNNIIQYAREESNKLIREQEAKQAGS